MLTALSIVSLGFFLGMRHATDPDHVIAITTIVSRERSVKRAAWSGAVWGIGHTVTIVLVGGAIILFNVAIPARLGLLMELSVGVMLVVLGVMNVTGTTNAPKNWLSRTQVQFTRPLAVGIVHGLAGSAAVALLVLTTIRTPAWAVAYLLVFGLGTVLGMVLVTTLMGVPFAYTSRQFSSTNRRLQLATGLISIGFGILLTYKIGYLDGLLTAAPVWVPR
ncbi:MAG: high-affinity nickel-transport family protein [Vicinamibacterales bacterium]